MEFAGALTLILLKFVGEELAGALSINTLASGVTGNRTDALVMYLWDRIWQDKSPLTEQLNRAIWLSYKQALAAIASGRRTELIGSDTQIYRGRAIYPADSRDAIRWYDSYLDQLKAEIKEIKNQQAPLPVLSLDDINTLMVAAQDESVQLVSNTTARLVTVASEGAPGCYGPAITAQLTEQVYGYFAQQMSEHKALWIFVQTSFLQGLNRNDQTIIAILHPAAEGVEQLKVEIEQLKAMLRKLLEQSGALASAEKSQDRIIVVSTSVPNPFLHRVGQIEDPELFWGRERELSEVFGTLNGGMSVALIGEREIGKSSLLKAIERAATTQLKVTRKALYVNLHDVSDENDFYYAICDSIGIETCSGFKLKRALTNQRILLLLDEIEKMTWDGFTNQVRSQLRGLAEGGNAPFKLVVTASQSLDRLFPDSGDGKMVSPLAGICLETEVKPWSADAIHTFIQARLATTEVRFTATEIEQLIQGSGGNPKQVVGQCYDLYSRYQGRS